MEKLLKKFEYYIVIGLLAMMALVVFLSTVELAVIIVQRMLSELPHLFLLNISEMLEIFGFFMMVLIGLELIETIKVYLVDESIHIEIICLVAIVAITRKVIILDLYKLPPVTLLGIAAIILALCLGYFFLKKAMNEKSRMI
ncbi:MAG: phosphate-starvation-inducible PsiE family protein [Deltaproteobacteria bacterium]|nr:MAG: phosphate-starvation-inducible PsiE family protein [Deltaproteobacteria bacterium]